VSKIEICRIRTKALHPIKVATIEASASMKVEGSKLTKCGLTADGEAIQLSFADAAGDPATVVLPLELARACAAVLPQLLSFALRRRTGDDAARHVFRFQNWSVDAAPDSRVIITVGNPDGFEISFTLPIQESRALSRALDADAQSRAGRAVN
jgi:hypothetical protein